MENIKPIEPNIEIENEQPTEFDESFSGGDFPDVDFNPTPTPPQTEGECLQISDESTGMKIVLSSNKETMSDLINYAFVIKTNFFNNYKNKLKPYIR